MIKINSYAYKCFSEKRPYIHNSVNIEFQKDLADIYGLEVDESLLVSGLNNSYSFMGSSLIDQLLDLGNRIDDVDLVILVYCIPDISLSTSSVNFFIEKYALNANGFGVSGADTYTPFAAMKVIKELFFTRKYKKALLLMLDQSTLSYPVTKIKGMDDIGIALLIETEGTSPFLELEEWGYETTTDLSEWVRAMNLNQSDNLYIISSNLEEKYVEMPSDFAFISSRSQLCTSLFAKLFELIKEDKVQKGRAIYLLDGSLVKNEMYYMKFKIYGGKM